MDPVRQTAVRGPAVATALVPAAADAALRILARGGNAYDAAVAACLLETVWLPMKCGLAGDLVALVREPGGDVQTLISVGPGGSRFSPEAGLTVTGPRSVGVPGAPDGYSALAARGRLSLGDTAAPAIEAARSGVTWLPVAVSLTREARDKLEKWSPGTVFLPGGRLPVAGETLRLPQLAGVMEAFVERGPRLFWDAIGAAMIDRLDALDGLLELEDLRVRPAYWAAPDNIDLAGEKVLSVTPAPTHGPRLLDAVRLVTDGGREPPDAMRAASRPARQPAEGGTSVVAVGDRDGRMVIVVHSNSFPQYGAGVVLDEFGLVLNNRPGRGFDLDVPADHPNAPMPGRVPTTTLHAWHLLGDNTSCGGATPGGLNQAPWNLQTIIDLLDGLAPADIVTAPRWGFDRSGGLLVESDHPRLAGLGGRSIQPLGHASAQQLLIRDSAGWLACADPRIGAVARAAKPE